MTVTDLLNEVQRDLRSGSNVRRELGNGEPVWPVLDGLYNAGRFFDVSETGSMDFSAITIADSATPAGKVATGSPKPAAATVASGPVSLSAYAGVVTVDTRTVLGAQNLAGAVLAVLRRQGVRAFETDVATEIASTDNVAVGTGTIVENVAAAQATLIGMGGVPDVLAVDAATYGALAGSTQNREDGLLIFLGSAIYLNPALTGAFVCDKSALNLVAHSSGLVVDAGTDTGGTNSNKVTILAESYLAAVLGNDGVVPVAAEVTLP